MKCLNIPISECKLWFSGFVSSGLLIALFGGCGTVPSDINDTIYLEPSVEYEVGDTYGDAEGYLVISMTRIRGAIETWHQFYDEDSIGRFTTFTLSYRGISQNISQVEGKVGFLVSTLARKRDFRPRYGRSWVFVIPLPEGDYEFNDFLISLPASTYDTIDWRAEREFSIPFTIKRGEIAYLGEWRLFRMKEKGPFTAIIPGGGFWTNSDKSNRDMEYAISKYDFLKELPVFEKISNDALELYFGQKDPLGND